MKTLPNLASLLALAALLPAAYAQAPATSHDNPSPAKPSTSAKTADRRAAAYKGPHVVKDTKGLGQKMLKNSEPATKPVSPVKE